MMAFFLGLLVLRFCCLAARVSPHTSMMTEERCTFLTPSLTRESAHAELGSHHKLFSANAIVFRPVLLLAFLAAVMNVKTPRA